MAAGDQLERLWSSLAGLGPRRLAALGAVGVAIFVFVGFGSYYLSRPDLEVLYVGLSQSDVARVGAVLHEAGISFDANAEGTKVLVKRGEAARARALLAERGLPNSATAGYELFDKLGSMGLTSFMQNVTRVRALEGEIARTIQAMKGVRAARVHLVLSEPGSFRQAAASSFSLGRHPDRFRPVPGRRRHPPARFLRGSRLDAGACVRAQHRRNRPRGWR